jgi:signal transduction histidine kinase
MLRIGAEFVAPFVIALLHEEQDQRTRDITNLYMMHNILTKMAKTYNHKVNQDIPAATLSLAALNGIVPRLDEQEKICFDILKQSVSSFAELSKNFVAGLPNYVQFGPTPLLPLLETAAREFDLTERKKTEDIELKTIVDAPLDLQVFGSPLIAEHIYNLVKNSFDSVRTRIKEGGITKGMISVTVKIVPQTDKCDTEDSFPLVVLDIEDNGGGLSPEAEANWGRPTYTTKVGRGGSGFGVPSAVEYLTALRGKLEKINGYPHKLNVLLYLPTYVDEIHGPLSGRPYFGKSIGTGER